MNWLQWVVYFLVVIAFGRLANSGWHDVHAYALAGLVLGGAAIAIHQRTRRQVLRDIAVRSPESAPPQIAETASAPAEAILTPASFRFDYPKGVPTLHLLVGLLSLIFGIGFVASVASTSDGDPANGAVILIIGLLLLLSGTIYLISARWVGTHIEVTRDALELYRRNGGITSIAWDQMSHATKALLPPSVTFHGANGTRITVWYSLRGYGAFLRLLGM
jgi:hypothetical protein